VHCVLTDRVCLLSVFQVINDFAALPIRIMNFQETHSLDQVRALPCCVYAA
jgi:glucokinase